MKIHLTAFTIFLICTFYTAQADAANLTPSCYTAPLCDGDSTPDSTCDGICLNSRCPSGTPSLPAGYTGKITGRARLTKCNSDGTFSCYCGMSSMSNLSCASGYTGTAKYEYVNGKDSFSGCTKSSGGTDPILACQKGSYKSGKTCVPCPADNNVNGTTARLGATAITECYIPADTPISDATGTYIYTSDCYYTNISIGDLDPSLIN